MKSNIAETVFTDDVDIKESDRRYQIFSSYSIVYNVRVDIKAAFKWENFVNFVSNNLQRNKKSQEIGKTNDKPKENPFEDLVSPAIE